MAGLTLNRSIQLLSSIDNCEFRGSTPFANYYRFENSYELALELNEQTFGSLSQVSIWLSNLETIKRFISHQTHARLFEKGKNRSKYLGNRIFARSLEENCEAVRLQISDEHLFLLIVDTYRGIINDTSNDDVPIAGNQSTETESASHETDLNHRIVEYLRSHPKEINKSIDEQGRTPLIYAIQSKDFNLVRQLIKLGAGLKVQDINGRSALDYVDMQGQEFIEEFREKVFPNSPIINTKNQSEDLNDSRLKIEDESENEKEGLQSVELTGENLYDSDFYEQIVESGQSTAVGCTDSLSDALDVSQTISNNELCNQLNKLKIPKKLKLVYFGLKSGWSIDQVRLLVGNKYLRKNSFLVDLLNKYFESMK